MRQLFRNLIGNAIKYTPRGGEVSLMAKATDTQALIEVKDNGYGIPASDLPFIFNRFYRVRSGKNGEEEGNGLGLAIVKSIVEHHGGQINVESEPQKGTNFSISLPVLTK
jgi:signal transduction histidine kinase